MTRKSYHFEKVTDSGIKRSRQATAETVWNVQSLFDLQLLKGKSKYNWG